MKNNTQTATIKGKISKKKALSGGLLTLSLCIFLPIQAFAKNSADIQSSVNSAGEATYDFFIGIAFWIAVVMVGLGFLILKFNAFDRSGRAQKIIVNALFGVAGLFAAPQIVTFVINLVK